MCKFSALASNGDKQMSPLDSKKPFGFNSLQSSVDTVDTHLPPLDFNISYCFISNFSKKTNQRGHFPTYPRECSLDISPGICRDMSTLYIFIYFFLYISISYTPIQRGQINVHVVPAGFYLFDFKQVFSIQRGQTSVHAGFYAAKLTHMEKST